MTVPLVRVPLVGANVKVVTEVAEVCNPSPKPPKLMEFTYPKPVAFVAVAMKGARMSKVKSEFQVAGMFPKSM